MTKTRNFAPGVFAGLRRPVGIIALGLACLASVYACTDGAPVTAVDSPSAFRLSLVPRFHVSGSSSLNAPINLAHLTVLDGATRDTLAPTVTVTLDPNSSTWSLPVDFEMPDGETEVSIIVIVELLNVTNGIETVEWSGQTAPISVELGHTPPAPAPIDLTPGPADNLTVTDVTITPVTTRIVEGDQIQMHAVVIGSGSPRVFWDALDPAIATVNDNGAVSTLAAGNARIVALTGPRADTITLTIAQRPSSLRMNVPTLSFGTIGQQITLTGSVLDPRGVVIAGETVNFTVGDATVISQPTPGTFRALKAGVTFVTAIAASTPGVTLTIPANVILTPSSIALTPDAFTLQTLGGTRVVTAVVRDASGAIITSPTIAWTTENAAVATVAADGTVTARGSGSTGIVATAGTATARAVVTVTLVATNVTVAPTPVILDRVGATAALTATARDASGAVITPSTFTWTSSAPAIATVNANGVVTGTGVGNAVITATAVGGASGTAQITVRQPVVASVEVAPVQFSFSARDESAAFTATARDASGNIMQGVTFTWRSSDPNVVLVDEATGVATAVNNGSAGVIAVAPNNISGRAQVVVQRTAARLGISPDTMTLGRGQQRQLTATVQDANGYTLPGSPPVTWRSFNPAKATVSSTGLVTAIDTGTVVIEAFSGNIGGSARVTISSSNTTTINSGRMLIWFSDGDANDVENGIVSTGIFTASQVDQLQMGAVAPLSTLTQYSCVMVFTNYPPPSGLDVGNRLREYVDAGGRVVLTTYSFSQNWIISGGITAPGYSPFLPTNRYMGVFPRSLNFTTALTGHSLLAGVSNFTYGGNSNYAEVDPAPGATIVARDNYGIPLLGVNATGNVIGINLFPRSSNFAHSTGVDRVLANACAVNPS